MESFAMHIRLHKNARITSAIRAEIAASSDSVATLTAHGALHPGPGALTLESSGQPQAIAALRTAAARWLSEYSLP
jgi:hypothetical protein